MLYQVSSYGLDSQAFDLNLKLSSLMVLFLSILLLPPGYLILVASYYKLTTVATA